MVNSQLIFLATAMVVTGTINTITAKLAMRTSAVGSDGDKHSFDVHPYFQTVGMFIGEFLCLLAYKAIGAYGKMTNQAPQKPTKFNPFIFMLPAACDMVASSAMTVGLAWTYASVYQMLRGSVIICTGIFSVIFLKRKLKMYHWLGMVLVLIGLLLVGAASVIQGGDSSDASNPLLGDIIVVSAQLVVATQMVIEEKFIAKHDVPPLLVVGWEGVFGFFMLSTVMIPLYYIPSSFANGAMHDDAIDAFAQMGNSWIITVALIGNLFSIAFFNFFGISITKYSSATTRTVIDSVRTVTIWAFSLIVGWQDFQWLQIVGFAFLLSGTLVYNEVVVLRFLGPHFTPEPKTAEKQPLLTNSEEDDYT